MLAFFARDPVVAAALLGANNAPAGSLDLHSTLNFDVEDMIVPNLFLTLNLPDNRGDLTVRQLASDFEWPFD
jgi:hypothetical protein